MITTQKILASNPWWEAEVLIETDDKLRELKLQLYPYQHPLLQTFPLNQPGVMTLRGPRQIGKTTLLKQLIRKLIYEKSIYPANIFYYSCNTIADYNELYDLLNLYLEESSYQSDKHIYIFLDEISFVKEWQRAIKDFTENRSGKQTLFLLTGSSTVDLEFSSERLPGRRGRLPEKDVLFLPLTFAEYTKLINPDSSKWERDKISFHLPRLRKIFKNYLLTGGFPAVFNEYYKTKLISSDTYKIYYSWILGDMHKLGKSENITGAIISKLLTSLTTPLSYYKIAKQTSLASHTTVSEYLELLERLFAVFKTDCFLIAQKRADLKKNRKFYFYDPFILFTLWAQVENMLDEAFSFSQKNLRDQDFLPKLVENIAGTHLKREFAKLYYGKLGKQEVDFVGFAKGKYSYYEIKYQRQTKTAPLQELTEKIPRQKLITISRNTQYTKRGQLQVIPAEPFLFNL